MMMLSTLALMAAAPLALADADAPAPVVMDRWESCEEQLEQATAKNATHTLTTILNSKKLKDKNGGEDSALAPLIEMASQDVKDALMAMDLSGDGYTLMLPANKAKNYSNPNGPEIELAEQFPELNTTMTTEEVDAILKAHVIPDTLNYEMLEEAVKDAGTEGYMTPSLMGYYNWTWKWVDAPGDGGYIALVDTLNITGSKDGYVTIDSDISVHDACPNRVYLLKGYMVPYDEIDFAASEAEMPAEMPGSAPSAGSPGTSTDRSPGGVGPGESSGASGMFSAAAAAAGAAVLAALL